MIRPAGGQPLDGLSAARGLAALKAFLEFLVIIYEYFFNIVRLILELTLSFAKLNMRAAGM
jgi:hypothetical protein